MERCTYDHRFQQNTIVVILSVRRCQSTTIPCLPDANPPDVCCTLHILALMIDRLHFLALTFKAIPIFQFYILYQALLRHFFGENKFDYKFHKICWAKFFITVCNGRIGECICHILLSSFFSWKYCFCALTMLVPENMYHIYFRFVESMFLIPHFISFSSTFEMGLQNIPVFKFLLKRSLMLTLASIDLNLFYFFLYFFSSANTVTSVAVTEVIYEETDFHCVFQIHNENPFKYSIWYKSRKRVQCFLNMFQKEKRKKTFLEKSNFNVFFQTDISNVTRLITPSDPSKIINKHHRWFQKVTFLSPSSHNARVLPRRRSSKTFISGFEYQTCSSPRLKCPRYMIDVNYFQIGGKSFRNLRS